MMRWIYDDGPDALPPLYPYILPLPVATFGPGLPGRTLVDEPRVFPVAVTPDVHHSTGIHSLVV
jgi:hypothetical protein